MSYQPPLNHRVFYDSNAVNTLYWQDGADGVAIRRVGGWFDGPEVRDTRHYNAGRDGEFADNLFLGGRTITLEGVVSGASYSDLQARKRALAEVFQPSLVERVLKMPVPDVWSGSIYSAVLSRFSPTAWWRLNDVASPPVSNSYDAAILARSDTVAYWELGEASGTTAANSVAGGAYPGTIAGSPVMGVAGPLLGSSDTAITFDGSNDGVSIANVADLHPANVTMIAWVRPTAVSGRANYVLSTQETGFKGIGLRLDDTGTVQSRIGDGVANSSVTGTSDIPLGTWAHIALTYDGSTVRVYRDGVLENSGADAYATPTSGARIGYGAVSNFNESFRGQIAKVSLHNTVLSAADIANLFTRGRPIADTPPATTYANEVLARTDTVALWKLGEGAGATTAANSVAGGAYPGTYTNGPLLGVTGPFTGSNDTAVDFDGTNDYVNVPYAAAVNPVQFTLAAWIYRDADTGGAEHIAQSSSTTEGYTLRIGTTDKLELRLGDGAFTNSAIGTTSIPTGRWVHVACTYDGTNARVYVDGVLDASGVDGYTPNASGVLRIGSNVGGTERFNGKIAMVSLHNTALSATDIANLYNAGVNENTYNGGMIGNPAAAAGVLLGDTNAALDFNGSSDAVVIPYAPVLNAATFSVSGWIMRDTDTGGVEVILQSRSGTASGYSFRINASDKLELNLVDGASSQTSGITNLVAGQWHHVAATYDGTTARLYVNGVLDGSGADAMVANTSAPATIGVDHTLSGDRFNGKIDELSYHANRVLTANEITELYTAGKDAYANAIPGYERATARVIEAVEFGENEGPLLQSWAVVLRASDPRIYNDIETTTLLTTAGGLQGTVINNGSIACPAYAGFKVVSGAATTFITTNITNATKSAAAANAFLNPGEELNVDARTRTAELIVEQSSYRLGALIGRTLLKLNETTGTTATDAGLNALDWTYVGSPTLNQDGPFIGSKSVAFDGTNDEITRAYNSAYNKDVFTIDCWLKPTADGFHGIIDWGNNSPNGWMLNLQTESNQRAHGFEWVGNTGVNVIGTHINTQNDWIHIAIVRNYSLWEFYINGRRASSWVVPITNITSGTYRLGRTIFVSTSAWFTGRMSNFGFYNTALRADQIKPLYQFGANIIAPGSQYIDFANTTWLQLEPGDNTISTATPFAAVGSNDFLTTIKHRDSRL